MTSGPCDSTDGHSVIWWVSGPKSAVLGKISDVPAGRTEDVGEFMTCWDSVIVRVV